MLYKYSFICMLSFLLDESVFVPTFRLSLYIGDNNNAVTFFYIILLDLKKYYTSWYVQGNRKIPHSFPLNAHCSQLSFDL